VLRISLRYTLCCQ